MKNVDESTDCSHFIFGLDSIPGTYDVLKKRTLVNRVLEVVYAPEPIMDDLYSQVMWAIDRSRSIASLHHKPVGHLNTVVGISGSRGHESICAQPHIKCPDRPTKTGRPPNTSLQSWREEQKRNTCESTDEENPRGGKTRLINDVLSL